MSKTRIEQAVAKFRADSKSKGIDWPPLADAVFIAGLSAGIVMAKGKTDQELVDLMMGCLQYAMKKYDAAKPGTMQA